VITIPSFPGLECELIMYKLNRLIVYEVYSIQASVGTVENHGTKWQKTRQTFVKIAKITAKTRHQITRPNTIYTVYKIQHPASLTIITCSARFSSVKFCHCGALTNSRKGKIHISMITSRSQSSTLTLVAGPNVKRFCVKITQ